MPMPAQVCPSQICMLHAHPLCASACIASSVNAGMSNRTRLMNRGMHACAWCNALHSWHVPPTHSAVCNLQLKMFLPMGIMWAYNKVRSADDRCEIVCMLRMNFNNSLLMRMLLCACRSGRTFQ
jgi:hypothetical protein